MKFTTRAVQGLLGAVILGLGSVSAPAWAQTPAAETFEPQALEATAIWSVATSEVGEHLMPGALLMLHFADNPVQVRREGGVGPVARLIDDQFKAELGLGVGLFERLELGLVLPVVLYQTGDSFPTLPTADSPEMGEMRAHVRGRILQAAGFGLGAQLTGYLPTSRRPAYQSNGKPGLLATLIADYGMRGSIPWRVAANVGWVLRDEQVSQLIVADDRLDFRLGGEVEVLPGTLHVLAMTAGRWEALVNPQNAVSAEYLGGARIFWGDSGWSSTLGAGGGYGRGYGTPDLRLLASIAFGRAAPRLDEAPSQDLVAPCAPGEGSDCAGALPPAREFAQDGSDLKEMARIAAYSSGCAPVAADFDGVYDADGCPVPGSESGARQEDHDSAASVRMIGDRLEILERVHFETASARILPQSFSLLNQVASVLKARPDIKRLRVLGHTDAQGDEAMNLELSQQRAASVKDYLVKRGIDADRLSARGYGLSHPIADNDTVEGRAANRRVEFRVVERSEP